MQIEVLLGCFLRNVANMFLIDFYARLMIQDTRLARFTSFYKPRPRFYVYGKLQRLLHNNGKGYN